MLPTPVGTRITTFVSSELKLSTVVTIERVGNAEIVGATAIILVSTTPESVTLMAVYVVAVTIVVTCISTTMAMNR